MSTNDLESRSGLPDALRFLVEKYPRDIWEGHGNFDALTRFWLSRHLEFRRAVALLLEETAAGLDRRQAPEMAARRLAGITGFLIDALHTHHTIEDQHYFPIFTATEPRLARGFEILDADHHALHRHLDALTQGTRALLDAVREGADPAPAIGRHRVLTERFGTFLDRHLIDEEDLIVPIVLEYAPDTGH